VINRGNYRADIFKAEGARAAFEACLFEACEKSDWVLHAYVLMSNHYHLALETPSGNLVAGMHWLQATFANRFNKLRGERGHLFQGRYKALVVEEGMPLGQVCHYIHLNPVRAGVAGVEKLSDYRHGSYWYLRRPKQRPGCLRVESALIEAGGLPDNPAGWARYAAYLDWQVSDGPAGKSKAYVNLSRGWAMGGQDFKAALVKDHAMVVQTRAWEQIGAKEVRRLQWETALQKALRATEQTEAALKAAAKSAPWKLALAAWLKAKTQASNGWLARRLSLGAPAALSRNLTHYRRSLQPRDRVWKKLTSISAA
jgi:REP element-mobilizing transposase RayT